MKKEGFVWGIMESKVEVFVKRSSPDQRLIHLEAKPLEDPLYNSAEPKLSDARNIVYITRATVENVQVGASPCRGSDGTAWVRDMCAMRGTGAGE